MGAQSRILEAKRQHFREPKECDTNLSRLRADRVVNTRRINATRAKIGALFLSMPYIGPPVAWSGGSPCLDPGSGEFGRAGPDAAERSHSFAGGRAERTRFGRERGVDALRGKK